MEEVFRIGTIGNYYGGLEICCINDKFFWGIEDHNRTDFEEIPQYLYDALIKYQQEL